MLLLNSETLPEGRDWLYELKLDGYRALALKTRGKVQLRSRNDNDFTARYPQIVEALAPLPNETVIDSEVVALAAVRCLSFLELLCFVPCNACTDNVWMHDKKQIYCLERFLGHASLRAHHGRVRVFLTEDVAYDLLE